MLLSMACRRDPEVPAIAEPVCEASALDMVLGAVEGASPDVAARLSARGLIEACPRLPGPLLLMLQGFESADPSTAALVVARGVADNAVLWTRACKGGVAAFSEMATLAPEARAPFLVSRCLAGGECPFAAVAELEATGPTEVTAALLAYQALIDGHVDAGRARAAARHLLGR